MRVLIISTRFSGGGAERSARELFESLQASGVEASMLVCARSPLDPPSVMQGRLPGERALHIFRKLFGPIDWIHIGSRLALRRIRRGNFDVVHMHNLHGHWISLKGLKALCRQMPSLWTLHDEWATTGGMSYDLSRVGGKYEQDIRNYPGTDLHFPDSAKSQQYRRYLDPRLPQPAILICPSTYMQGLVAKSGRFPGVQCEHVPYGLRFKDLPDVRISRQEARQQFGFEPSDKIVLLAAAHMRAGFKGIPIAVDALRELPADACKVLIMGRGGEEIAQSLPQKAVATGFIKDDARVAAVYRAADVTLVPSVADNFPYVALESMACATPLLAFRVGGLTEMVGNNERGLLARPFDVSEYATNIKSLLQSPERRELLGANGRNWVDQNCDMQKWTQKHIDLYHAAIERFQQTEMSAETARSRNPQEVLQ